MREIKFRGRRTLDNKWIYGSLLIDKDGSCEIFHYNKYGVSGTENVAPETVGQFIEKEDKSGIEIYEGDIVKIIFNHNSTGYHGHNPKYFSSETHIVEYYNCKFISYKPKTNPQPLNNYGYGELYNIADYKYEVIGNIYENESLLANN